MKKIFLLLFILIAFFPTSLAFADEEAEKIYFAPEQIITSEEGLFLALGDFVFPVSLISSDDNGLFANVLKFVAEKIYFHPSQLLVTEEGLFLDFPGSLIHVDCVQADEEGFFATICNAHETPMEKYLLICNSCGARNPRWNFYCAKCNRSLSGAKREAEKGDW